nr:NUDIX hydrolase [Kofleriaceae bacterium]
MTASALRDAAAVILLRRVDRAGDPFEVFLLRRRKGASFMAQAHVFPGGGCEPGEGARAAAVRELMEEAAVQVDPAALVPWAWWITPSAENPRRFSARFFAAELPAGATPKFDGVETVDQVWLAPRDAPAMSGQLRLPPPQLRTCWELAQYDSLDAVLGATRDAASAVLPRVLVGEPTVTLVLPWDRDYARGVGEAIDYPRREAGPSRYVMTADGWTGQ